MTGIHALIVGPLAQLFDPIPCLFCAFETSDAVKMEAHIGITHQGWEDELQYQSWKMFDDLRAKMLSLPSK